MSAFVPVSLLLFHGQSRRICVMQRLVSPPWQCTPDVHGALLVVFLCIIIVAWRSCGSRFHYCV